MPVINSPQRLGRLTISKLIKTGGWAELKPCSHSLLCSEFRAAQSALEVFSLTRPHRRPPRPLVGTWDRIWLCFQLSTCSVSPAATDEFNHRSPSQMRFYYFQLSWVSGPRVGVEDVALKRASIGRPLTEQADGS